MRKMACTTILVGKKASYDGSTMIARNDDSGSGHFTAKKFTVVTPKEQPKTYISVLSHVKVELPEQAMRYTSMPNAEKGEGIWAASGVNEANVAMTATETITTNPRVQGADPLVVYQPAKDGQEEVPGGIGEEDIVCLVLPYIKSAREGVARLGQLLETYGTYENNGIAFQDADEIWWLETIGGHHWMARKVPDDVYVVMPNQLGIDTFDLEDALGEQKGAPIRWWYISRQKTVRKKYRVVSERKTSCAWCFLILRAPARVLPDWDSFWKRMAHMKITESLSRMLTRSGGWRRSADITGWQEKCRMMCMW